MELSVRDWMIIVGVLLIIVVLFDGYRRIRNERRNTIRMSLNKQFLNSGDDSETEEFSSELPNGGARIIYRDPDSVSLGDECIADQMEKPQQQPPMLMDVDQPVNDEVDDNTESLAVDEQLDETVADSASDELEPAPAAESSTQPVVTAELAGNTDTITPVDDEVVDTTGPVPIASGADQEVLVINVMAKKGSHLQGPDLLHILLACDLRYGKMNIFHRHEQANGQGRVQFSVANLVEPGTFDLDAINDFSTPGVCFFLSLPGPDNALQAFECMVETAHCLVSNLDAELRDESHSALTNQTLEHYRQRIVERERRRMTQQA